MQKYPSHWFEPHELHIIHGEIRGTETSSPSHGRESSCLEDRGRAKDTLRSADGSLPSRVWR